MIEMERDKNQHRVRKWYAAKDIDEGEVSFKDHDEPRATSSDVDRPDLSSSSNMAMRGTKKRHDDEQCRKEVKRSWTSCDDSNSMRGTVRTPNDDETGAETKKQKILCLNKHVTLTIETLRANSSITTRHSQLQATNTRERHGKLLKIHQRDNMKYFIDVEERGITTNSAAVLSTLVARNIAKKTPTEGLCHVVQWHLTQRDKTSKLH